MTIWDTLAPSGRPLTGADVRVATTVHRPALAVGSLRITDPSLVRAELRFGELSGASYAWTLTRPEASRIAEAFTTVTAAIQHVNGTSLDLLRQAMTSRRDGPPGVGNAVSALLELAVADAELRARGQSLLSWEDGTTAAVRQRVYYSDIYDSYTDEQVRSRLRSAREAGIPGVKVRLGMTDLDWMGTRLALIRQVIGRQTPLMVDAVTNWSPAFADAACRLLERHQVTWIEDPFRPEALDELTAFCRYTPVPVCAGELCTSAAGIGDLITAGVSILMLDIQHLGGLSETMRAVANVRSSGRALTFHVFPDIGAGIAPGLQTWVEYAPLWGVPAPPLTDSGHLATGPDGIYAYQRDGS